jgi:hypothetical protein
VPIRIGEVEEPLAPFRVARCRRMVAGGNYFGVEGIDIGLMEDHASPP